MTDCSDCSDDGVTRCFPGATCYSDDGPRPTIGSGGGGGGGSGYGPVCSDETQLSDGGSIEASYAANSHCVWLLTCESGSQPALSFGSFSMESSYDYVILYDGESSMYPELGRWDFEDGRVPADQSASGSWLTVVLDADDGTEGVGFSASFTCEGGGGSSPTCFDGMLNGDEIEMDCGGSCMGCSSDTDANDCTASEMDFLQKLWMRCPTAVAECRPPTSCFEEVVNALREIQMPRVGSREYIRIVQCAESVTSSSALAGGAIMSVKSQLTLANCTLRGCAADRGGCIYQTGGMLRIDDVIIDQPQAMENGKGLYVSGCTDWRLRALSFLPAFEAMQSVYTVGSALSGCDDVGEFPCPVGSKCLYANYSITCQTCQAGKFSIAGLSCSSCPRGSGANSLQTDCEPCTGGKSSETNTCEDCAAGKYPRTGNDLCVACGLNTYSKVGTAECSLCPDGQEANAGGSDCTPCPEGQQGIDGICAACNIG